jgi:hypothetical protein
LILLSVTETLPETSALIPKTADGKVRFLADIEIPLLSLIQ